MCIRDSSSRGARGLRIMDVHRRRCSKGLLAYGSFVTGWNATAAKGNLVAQLGLGASAQPP
eukprot:14846168-Alexandrium_andersonii.AAC.1